MTLFRKANFSGNLEKDKILHLHDSIFKYEPGNLLKEFEF